MEKKLWITDGKEVGINGVKYQLPGGKEATKTIYDPKIYPDVKMTAMANIAANKALEQFQISGSKAQQITVNNVQFEVRLQIRDGKPYVPTVFPRGVVK